MQTSQLSRGTHRAVSYWTDSTPFPTFPRLDRDERADVLIVGGGITGLTAAWLLASAGKSVVVLERGRCAAADTGHTSAHLTMVTDTRLTELVRRFGQSHAQAVWDAGLAAIHQIDVLVRHHEIDCDFAWVDGYLHMPWEADAAGGDAQDHFSAEAVLARELGFDAEFVADVPCVHGAGIRFSGQARMHPRRYLAGLAAAIIAAGGRIYEQTETQEFASHPISVRANGHSVHCHDIVMATHNPLAGVGSMAAATLFQTKLALYTSYVIAGRVARGTVPDALFWDIAEPYHYLRVEPNADHDLVIFGGADHKTGQGDSELSLAALEDTLQRLVPGVTVTHRWSGQVIETPDGLPFIGQLADHQYAATGFGGNGLTFGTLAAMMAADAILGRSNPWADLFAPSRKALGRATWEYIKENADYPYYLIRDRFAGVESRPLRLVQRGEGAILEHDGRTVAVYRDEHGETTMRSATCTHMGCLVRWNAVDRTWDCPCHGSRFLPNGDVIAGPAGAPLADVEQPATGRTSTAVDADRSMR